MSNQTTDNNKTKPFSKVRMLLSTFLGVDISDDNSGLDSYINNPNIQSEEDKENARIAQELQNSLYSINSRILEMEKNSKPSNKAKRNSSTLSLKSEKKEVQSKSSEKYIQTFSKIDKDNIDLSL